VDYYHHTRYGRTAGAGLGRTQCRCGGAQPVVGCRHRLHPDLGRISLPRRSTGRVQSQNIVWAMGTYVRTDLVLEALNLVLWPRAPADVIHHNETDEGSQYTSIGWPKLRASRRAALDGFGGKLLRQCHVRKFLRHTGMWTARPPSLEDPNRSAHGDLPSLILVPPMSCGHAITNSARFRSPESLMPGVRFHLL
jgi:hypothetical protein